MTAKIINRCEHTYIEYYGDPYRITREMDFEDERTETISVYKLLENGDYIKIYNIELAEEIVASVSFKRSFHEYQGRRIY